MGPKDHAPRMGRAAPERRGRQEPLWSESEPDDLFDPDLAFAEARARLDAPLAPDAGLEAADELPGDPTEGPNPAAESVDSSPPPPDGEISDDLPVPPLDGDGDERESEDPDLGGVDTQFEQTPVDPSDQRFETPDDPRIPPERAFFKIGEVAAIVGVRPYVLRYWESELDFVSPEKTEAGQRRFRREDVATLLQVRRLRHDAGLTMAQTRALIREGRGSEVAASAASVDRAAAPWVVRDAEAQSRMRTKVLAMREAVLDLLQAIEDEGEEDHG